LYPESDQGSQPRTGAFSDYCSGPRRWGLTYRYWHPAMTELLNDGPVDAPARLMLAHGAGASMTSPFMETFSRLLAERGIAVTRFEFGYMTARRMGGKRQPPPKAELLMPEYLAAVEAVAMAMTRAQMLLVGGKSMGGRVASLIADDLYRAGRADGLVCLGYPFHPPGRPAELRTAHLAALTCPTLIVQGERDPFGSRAEIERFALSAAIRLHWAADGDHDFGPRGGRVHTRRGNLEAAADAVAEFAKGLRRR
jgi:predicted alpha/beta-hydrolase family hydrolase